MYRKNNFAHYNALKRGLYGLIVILLGISVARLLVSAHQMEERIEILENTVGQLLADTSRLAIPPSQATAYRPEYSSEPRHTRQPSYRRRDYAQAPAPTPTARPLRPEGDAQPVTADSTALQATAGDAVIREPEHSRGNDNRPRKFTEPHIFDLNTIDSLTLIRIPGIAERTASVILRWRVRYGGFYSPQQLRECLTWDAAQEYMDEWCQHWFTADASRLRPIHINAASVAELQRHPYITYEQARTIVRYRTRHRHIVTAEELMNLSVFTAQELERLLPYLSFDHN